MADVIKNVPSVKENYAHALGLLGRYLSELSSLPIATKNKEKSLGELVNTTLSTISAIENLNLKRDDLSNE